MSRQSTSTQRPLAVWGVVLVVCMTAQAEVKEIANSEEFVKWAENGFTGSENITLTGDLVFTETTTLTGPVHFKPHTLQQQQQLYGAVFQAWE